MIWSKFQQDGFVLTQKETIDLNKQVLNEYRLAKKAIDADIKEAYLKHLTGVHPDDYYNEMINFNRLRTLQAQITTEYVKHSRNAGTKIAQLLKLAMSNLYYRKIYADQWLVPGMKVGILPRDLIDLTIYGLDSQYKKITKHIEAVFGAKGNYVPQLGTLTDLLKGNRNKELQSIQRAITQGLTRGQSYTAMSKEIKAIIGTATPEGFTGAMANAQRIVRTEGTRTLNAGAYANTKYAESQGIDIKKQWDAALDNRTRSSHGRLDGVRMLPDEYFRIGSDQALYPGTFDLVKNNVFCRCAIIDIINDQNPQIRRGRDPVTGENEVFDFKSYDDWIKEKGLTKNIHGEILNKK